MDSEEEEITWLESGHEWLGRRVRRLFPGSDFADGTISAVRVLRHGSCSRPKRHRHPLVPNNPPLIHLHCSCTMPPPQRVQWVPADGEDMALWRMQHDDGDTEDLEEHEVTEGFAAILDPSSAVAVTAPVTRVAQARTARTALMPAAVRPEPLGERVLQLGCRVIAKYKQSRGWFHGTVAKMHADGTCAVRFDDGDQDPSVQPHHVRLITAVSVHLGGLPVQPPPEWLQSNAPSIAQRAVDAAEQQQQQQQQPAAGHEAAAVVDDKGARANRSRAMIRAQ